MAWNRLPSSYDVVARAYEARFINELEDKPRDREFLTAFANSAGDPVVEIGCGPGQIGLLVQAHGRHVVGLDISPEMAKLASQRLRAALVADFRALPLASGQVGALLAFYSLIHIPRTQLSSALSEFHRVLRPGGRVLFSCHQGEGIVELDEFMDEAVPFVATLFRLEELVEATTAAGLTVTMAEQRPPSSFEHPTDRLYVAAERPGAIDPD